MNKLKFKDLNAVKQRSELHKQQHMIQFTAVKSERKITICTNSLMMESVFEQMDKLDMDQASKEHENKHRQVCTGCVKTLKILTVTGQIKTCNHA